MKNIKRRTLEWMIAGGLLLGLVSCESNQSEVTRAEVIRPAKLVQAGRSKQLVRIYPGKVHSSQQVSLSFPVGGPIEELLVHEGQKVKKNDLLVRMDPRDYRVQVRNLDAQLKVAMAQYHHARNEYQRVRGLFEHDNASKSDLDAAQSSIEITKGKVEATEQALEAARLALQDTELRAPYSGLIAVRMVEAHQRVNPYQSVLVIQNQAGKEVVIQVPENEMSTIQGHQGAPIEVVFDAIPGFKVPAKIKEFSTQSDPLTQTFSVTLALLGDIPESVLAGMTADVLWPSSESLDQQMVLPLSALMNDASGQTFVWRLDPKEMRLHRVEIVTGELTDGGMEVRSGILPDDRILVAGVHLVDEGQQVVEWEK